MTSGEICEQDRFTDRFAVQGHASGPHVTLRSRASLKSCLSWRANLTLKQMFTQLKGQEFVPENNHFVAG